MKYIKQFGIILSVTCIGEGMNCIIPIPIPGNIYGLLLLLIFLITGVLKLEQVKEAGEFLVEIMPVMFIPAAAGLVDSWGLIRQMLIPLCVIVPVSTCCVMAVTGKVTDFLLQRKEEGGRKKNGCSVFELSNNRSNNQSGELCFRQCD